MNKKSDSKKQKKMMPFYPKMTIQDMYKYPKKKRTFLLSKINFKWGYTQTVPREIESMVTWFPISLNRDLALSLKCFSEGNATTIYGTPLYQDTEYLWFEFLQKKQDRHVA